MADVQLENGYLKIANDLAEAFSRLQLSGHEWRVLWAIIRRTYGWNKKEDWISGSQIAQDTGLNRVKVCDALKKLTARKIIVHEDRRTAIQKDYDLWQNVTENGNKKMLPKTVTLLPKTVTNVTENGTHKRQNTLVQKTAPTSLKEKTAAQDQGDHGMDLLLPLAALCKYDLAVITTAQKNDLYRAVGRLMNGAHATPKDIERFGEFWQKKDWRGKQEQPPTPDQVLSSWGAFRAWQANPNGSKPKLKFL